MGRCNLFRPVERPLAFPRPCRVHPRRPANTGPWRQDPARHRYDRRHRRRDGETWRDLSASTQGDRRDHRRHRAARAESDRGRSAARRQGISGRRRSAREITGHASGRAGRGRDLSGRQSAAQFRQRRPAGPFTECGPAPAAAFGIRRTRGSRNSQRRDRPGRHADVDPDAVPDPREDRTVIRAPHCRCLRH